MSTDARPMSPDEVRAVTTDSEETRRLLKTIDVAWARLGGARIERDERKSDAIACAEAAVDLGTILVAVEVEAARRVDDPRMAAVAQSIAMARAKHPSVFAAAERIIGRIATPP